MLGNRPSLLFLCQTLPYPADGGVSIRTYNIMRLLATAFDVTAVCFYRKSSRPTLEHVQASLRGLSEIADASAFPIPQENSRVRLLWDHIRSVVTRRVYTRYVYDSASFRRELRSLLNARRFSLVHLDSLDLARYLELLKGHPVICTHHNVESDLLLRRADNAAFPTSNYLRLQAELMKEEERRLCPEFTLNVAVSHHDAERLNQLAPSSSFTVVPNGVDTEYFRSTRPEGGRVGGLVFVGGYTWYPNRDALGFFAEAILPIIREKNPAIPVTWVGSAPDSIKRFFESKHDITLTGYVPDVRPYIDAAACYVVPLRVGGGTRLKILDAWSMGQAVVSTSTGAEGLEAVDGSNILIRDTPETFANAVVDVVNNDSLRLDLAQSARRTAEQIYDWRVIGSHLIRQYRANTDYRQAPA